MNDNMLKNYRLDLTISEMERLQEIIKYLKTTDEYNYYNELNSFISLNEKIQEPKKIKFSVNKSLAAQKATETRTKKAKAKIDNAINILRMEHKKITHYSIAKMAAVSYLTVKKYLSDNDIISLNKKK